MSVIVKAYAVVPKEKKERSKVIINSSVSGDGQEFIWIKTNDEYKVVFPLNDFAAIRKRDDVWEIQYKLKGEDFLGTRKTLKEAYHALDRMIWSKDSKLWVKTRSRVILEQFEGFDNMEEDNYELC